MRTKSELKFRPINWSLFGWTAALVWLCSISTVVYGQGVTQEQARLIIEELRQIKRELQEIRQRPAGALAPSIPLRQQLQMGSVGTSARPTLGQDAAPVTLVGFTDFQCSYCRKFFDQTLPGLREKYIDTGKLRFVFMDLPLDFHAQALPAARAAHCAGEQAKFWQMHDALFAGSGKLTDQELATLATKIGLDMSKFKSCTESDRFVKEIEAAKAEAAKVGIQGTPSFVLGKTEVGKDTVSGEIIVGAVPLATFEARIKQLSQ